MDRRNRQRALLGVVLSSAILVTPLWASPKSAVVDFLVRVKLMAPKQKASSTEGGDKLVVVIWHTDLKKARRESERTKRPMLIVFGATYCKHCKTFERDVLNHPAIAPRIADEFVPVHLDYDRNRRVAEVLEVDQFPYTVIMNSQADLLGTVKGSVGRKEFQNSLELAHALDTRTGKVQHASGRK